MKNTPPDNNEYRKPNEFVIHGPAGSFATTEAEFQARLAENKAKTEAFILAVDDYWKWLVKPEPIKLTNEQAAEDLLSPIVDYLVNEKRVAMIDIVSIVKCCVTEHGE